MSRKIRGGEERRSRRGLNRRRSFTKRLGRGKNARECKKENRCASVRSRKTCKREKKENCALAYAEEMYTVFIKASQLFKDRLN